MLRSSIACLLASVLLIGSYSSAAAGVNKSVRKTTPIVYGLRKFPYPYKAMLAISADADHQTLRKFNLIHEFTNTNDMTPMGRGVGLDIADSFFMYNGSDIPRPIDYGNLSVGKEFTYFKGVTNRPYAANIIDLYIHAGWIDTIHTFGDFSMVDSGHTVFTRDLATQALHALMAARDNVTVWTDHGNQSNVDNFGSFGLRPFFNYQQGANPWTPYYHADQLIPYGIKFVWTDQQSHVYGHESMIYPLRLPDGQTVWGFWRYTNVPTIRNHMGRWIWSQRDLSKELALSNLLSIESRHQYAIVAQHFSADNKLYPLSLSSIRALQSLALQYRMGNILVTRTSRLLQYNLTQKYVRYHVTYQNDEAIIHITDIVDPMLGTHIPKLNELRGVTFYTSDPFHTVIDIGNTPIDPGIIQYNPSDGVAQSIAIQWFASNTINYATRLPGIS